MKKIILPIILSALGIVLLGLSFLSFSSGDTDLDIQIDKASFIMPAAHRVYSNAEALDGKYYLFKAKIDNKGKKTLEDVTVKYRIQGYVDWTELEVSGQLFPGQSFVVPCYPKFKDEITKKMTSSMEKVEIEISWDDAEEDDIIEEDFSFKLTNRNEYVYTGIKKEEISGWSDIYDNDELIACFVTPNDPIVKYYGQNLQEKILQGEAAGISQDPKGAVRFLMGIYEATRLSHMVYSSTSGVPTSTDDVQSLIQHVRLPREVITGNTGLCIELSALYASILSSASIHPVIYFIPGHAYPGFRMNGQYYAIEATGINGEGLGGIASAEQAFEAGQKQLQEFFKRAQMGDPRYNLVDIHAINEQGITSMDLGDDSFLRKKVDEITASWNDSQNISNTQIVQTTQTGGSSSNSGNNNVRPSIRPSKSSALSMNIPKGWQVVQNPSPQMPFITAQVIAPDQITTATIFDVQTNNMQQAMQYIQQNFSYQGMTLDYQVNGNQISGVTYSDYGIFNWIGKAINGSQGIRIVAIGTADHLYQQNSGIINQVYNTIQ